jgi:hypothetical protein
MSLVSTFIWTRMVSIASRKILSSLFMFWISSRIAESSTLLISSTVCTADRIHCRLNTPMKVAGDDE